VTTGLTALSITLLLAAVNEGMVEWLFGWWIKGRYIRFVSLLGGLALAFAFQVRVLEGLTGWQFDPTADTVLAGLLMARGSQYVHDFYSRYLKAGGRTAARGS
jgi:hypothetical protein